MSQQVSKRRRRKMTQRAKNQREDNSNYLPYPLKRIKPKIANPLIDKRREVDNV